jgi:uncharacterized protein DUF1203
MTEQAELLKKFRMFRHFRLFRILSSIWLVAREQPDAGEIEKAIDRIFRNPAARYINVYSTKAGCFIAHVERIDSGS